MTNDDQEFEQLARTLRQIDEPPPTPREEIWARIQAERAARRNGGTPHAAPVAAPSPEQRPDVIPLPRPDRRAPWLHWGAALAAMLVLGIGLGRVSMRQATPAGEPPAASATTSPVGDGGDAGPYRLAATQHLQRTEALLASLAMVAPATEAADVSTWAGDLLTDTRLLLASPAADDAAIRQLLEDLELVLAQIASIPAARAEEEVGLIQDGLNQSDVLLRLRAATTVRRTVGT